MFFHVRGNAGIYGKYFYLTITAVFCTRISIFSPRSINLSRFSIMTPLVASKLPRMSANLSASGELNCSIFYLWTWIRNIYFYWPWRIVHSIRTRWHYLALERGIVKRMYSWCPQGRRRQQQSWNVCPSWSGSRNCSPKGCGTHIHPAGRTS